MKRFSSRSCLLYSGPVKRRRLIPHNRASKILKSLERQAPSRSYFFVRIIYENRWITSYRCTSNLWLVWWYTWSSQPGLSFDYILAATFVSNYIWRMAKDLIKKKRHHSSNNLGLVFFPVLIYFFFSSSNTKTKDKKEKNKSLYIGGNHPLCLIP